MIDEMAMTSPEPVDIRAIINMVINRYPPVLPSKLSITNGVIYPEREFHQKLYPYLILLLFNVQRPEVSTKIFEMVMCKISMHIKDPYRV